MPRMQIILTPENNEYVRLHYRKHGDQSRFINGLIEHDRVGASVPPSTTDALVQYRKNYEELSKPNTQTQSEQSPKTQDVESATI